MRIRYSFPKVSMQALRRVFRHFGHHLRPHRMKLLLGFGALLGVSMVNLLRPWPLKIVFDYILLPTRAAKGLRILSPLSHWEPMSVLLLVAISVLGLAVLGGTLGYARDVLSKTVGHKVAAEIRLQLFSHVQRLPQSYHDYRETGDLITRLTGDISLLQDLLVDTVMTLAGRLVLIVGMLTWMFWIDWQLALVALAIMPLFALVAFTYSGRIKKAARKQRQKYGKMVTSVQETFAGISQVKVFAQEKYREKLVAKSVGKDMKASLKTTKLSANYARMVEIIIAVGTCLILWLGVKKAISGAISSGDLIVFLSYLRGVYRPIQAVARLSTRIAKATVRGEKIMEILELEPEVRDRENAISADGIRGDIRFEGVGFSYVSERQVLRGFSCRIPPGKTTMIIGPTGAGKSTVAKLLLRLYEPSEGRIFLDGRDIAEYKVRSLREKITNLTQETFLFRTSIQDNIAFGKPKASQREVEAAARLVGADEFVRQLPEGYNTLVGESGLTLSGGQRQRIGFARAALRDSPIMVFDEPATGLDIHAEKEAKRTLSILKKNRTLIIITHRLNFLDIADWVVLIQDGRMIEEGTPPELFQRGKSFVEFVSGTEGYSGQLTAGNGQPPDTKNR